MLKIISPEELKIKHDMYYSYEYAKEYSDKQHFKVMDKKNDTFNVKVGMWKSENVGY